MILNRAKTSKLAFVIILAIVVRLAFLVIFADTLDFTQVGNAVHGSESYDLYAQNLLETGVYGLVAGEPDSLIPPMYSYVLAVVYSIIGRGYIQVGLFNTLLDVIAITFLWAIGRRLFQKGEFLGQPIGEWVGAGAGLFYALYPYLVFQNLTVIDTPLWMALFYAFIYLMIPLRERESFDRGTWGVAILAGVVLGVSVVARPILPFFALLVPIWFLMRRSFVQTVVRLLPVALIGVALVIPWIVRNYGLYNDFVPMTTTSGANFWQGSSEWTIPVFEAGYDVQWTAPAEGLIDESQPEHEQDSQRFALGIDFLSENTDQIPQLLWTKFKVHWSIPIAPRYNPQFGEVWELSETGDLVIRDSENNIVGVTASNVSYNETLLDTLGRPVHVLYFGGLFGLGLMGMIFALWQWRLVTLLWIAQISMTVTYLLFHPSTRYRVPTDPLLFLFSAYALLMIAQWLMHRRKSNI